MTRIPCSGTGLTPSSLVLVVAALSAQTAGQVTKTFIEAVRTISAATIEISRDGGTSWTTIASPVANSGNTIGSYSWGVTGPATTTARIRVRWTVDGAVQAVSANFRVQ